MKQIKINSDSLSKKISVIGSIFFGSLSDTESAILVALIEMGDHQIVLHPALSKQIKTQLNLNDSTFNVILGRLHKKKAINKQKSNIILSPILLQLSATNDWLIKFVAEG